VERVRALRAQTGDAPFELVLKLEAEPDRAGDLPAAVAAIAGLGFDETVVDLPWSEGVDRACETLGACRDAARPTEAR
jgi:hypothetical protein